MQVGRKGEEGQGGGDEKCERRGAEVEAALERMEAVSRGSVGSSVEEGEGRRWRG